MSTAERGPKEKAYDTRVAPLMEKIIALCKKHKINFAATFCLDGDLCCDSVGPNDPDHAEGMARIAGLRLGPREPSLMAFTITK